MPDADGYPTEKELKKVRNWPVKEISDCVEYLEYIRTLWWQDEWGFSIGEKVKGRYYLSTGGWSGNEEILNAMKSCVMFWMLCWQSSRRGGHYIFDVPEERP